MVRKLKLKKRGEAGFTVVELLVAMALMVLLSSLVYATFLSLHKAVFFQQEKNTLRMQGEVLTHSLLKKLRHASILLMVGEDKLVFNTEEGRLQTYELSEEGLLLNGKLVSLPVSLFQVEPLGALLSEADYEKQSELDVDGSGVLEMEELDLDLSGVLEGKECAKIGLIKIRLQYLVEEKAFSHHIWVHPRNHPTPLVEVEDAFL